jgi:hypothetical protein
MPDRKRLGLENPVDLWSKLQWEIDQLGVPVDQETVASYRAFNCAVTAWSICDWVWNAAAPDLRERLRAESPNPNANGSEPLASSLREQSRELAICQQLANGSKHFILDRHNDATVSSYRSASVSFYLSDDGKTHSVPTYGIFIEDGDRTYSDLALFSRARDFWHGFFKRYGLS